MCCTLTGPRGVVHIWPRARAVLLCVVQEKMERALSERGALSGAIHGAAFSRSPFSSAAPATDAYADVSAFSAADGTRDGGGGDGVSSISEQHASVSPSLAAYSVQMLTPSSH